jgi:hypothetical protein
VVATQDTSSLDAAHVPEPWNGDIAAAPILFISSNPSFDAKERFPIGLWTDAEIASFFHDRFEKFIADGVRPERVGGGPKGNVRFLVEVRAIARKLLGREVVPGEDYVLTEVVHCKSRNNRGVAQAAAMCSTRWLQKVLDASEARVVIVLGVFARQAVAPLLGSDGRAPVERDGRFYVFLGAQGSNQPRKLSVCVPDPAVREAIVATARDAPFVRAAGGLA